MFVIPQSPEWPNQLAGFALGQKLDYLKKHPSLLAGKPDKKEELNKLGKKERGRLVKGGGEMCTSADVSS